MLRGTWVKVRNWPFARHCIRARAARSTVHAVHASHGTSVSYEAHMHACCSSVIAALAMHLSSSAHSLPLCNSLHATNLKTLRNSQSWQIIPQIQEVRDPYGMVESPWCAPCAGVKFCPGVCCCKSVVFFARKNPYCAGRTRAAPTCVTLELQRSLSAEY